MRSLRTALAVAPLALLAVAACSPLGADDRDRDRGRRLPPIMRIVSPLADATVPLGEGRPGAGSPNGTGFALNLELVTRSDAPVEVKESTNIRHVELLGQPNPDFPSLEVFVDTDLVKPDGGIIPEGTNLASLFNVAGTDDTPGPGVTVWAGWHVLESLPTGVESFIVTARGADVDGRETTDRITVHVDDAVGTSAQALTPAPGAVGGDSVDDHDGPEVDLLAPRLPTSVAIGPAGTPSAPSGSLFFLQVNATDRTGAGIGVSENGPGNGAGLGSILDASQIGAAGPNRFYPGLVTTFDVPLRRPNGNLVPAGANLSPLFNVAGTEVQADGAVRTVADWVVGGSLELPAGKRTVTITTSVTDSAGRTGSDSSVVGVSATGDGQALTAAPTATRLTAVLDGTQEVTDAGQPGAGDLDGGGIFTLDVNARRGDLCYRLDATGTAAATRFHIHRGERGANGPIVVPFFETGEVPAASGCLPVDRALAREITNRPERFYVNVHTAEFPAGAIRGQLAA